MTDAVTSLIERVYDHIEADHTDRAVMTCLRIAKSIGDTVSVVMFLRELHPNKDQLDRAFHDETRALKEEARRFIWEHTLERWIEERSLGYSLSEDDENAEVLAVGVGELQKELGHFEKAIADYDLPLGMGEFDTAAFMDRYARVKMGLRMRLKANMTVLERIRTRCLQYASRVERQIVDNQSAHNVLGTIQLDVQNYYAERCPEVYERLSKADSLLASSAPEDHALLLTAVRRAIKAVADCHFPARSEPTACHDGQTRDLSDDKYLNRLREFCATALTPCTETDLIRAELESLAVFVTRVNSVASKGVHAAVTPAEARHGLLALYLFLSAVLAKMGARGTDG